MQLIGGLAAALLLCLVVPAIIPMLRPLYGLALLKLWCLLFNRDNERKGE